MAGVINVEVLMSRGGASEQRMFRPKEHTPVEQVVQLLRDEYGPGSLESAGVALLSGPGYGLEAGNYVYRVFAAPAAAAPPPPPAPAAEIRGVSTASRIMDCLDKLLRSARDGGKDTPWYFWLACGVQVAFIPGVALYTWRRHGADIMALTAFSYATQLLEFGVYKRQAPPLGAMVVFLIAAVAFLFAAAVCGILAWLC